MVMHVIRCIGQCYGLIQKEGSDLEWSSTDLLYQALNDLTTVGQKYVEYVRAWNAFSLDPTLQTNSNKQCD